MHYSIYCICRIYLSLLSFVINLNEPDFSKFGSLIELSQAMVQCKLRR
jgi:hypothetical protein